MGKLNGKVAFITGATSGIGEASALLFAKEGASIAVLGSHDMAKSMKVSDAIKKGGGKALPLVADVTKPAEMKAAVGKAVKELGEIDILICSAGIFIPTPAGATSDADYHRQIDINVGGTWNAIQEVAESMKKRKTGWIVVVSSCLGELGLGGYALYGASKAAANMLTKCVAIELAPHGVHVNGIAPGNTATPMNQHLRTDPQYQGYLDMMRARTPSPRVYSDAEDMARAALFLSCDDSKAMYGHTMTLDEGLSLGL